MNTSQYRRPIVIKLDRNGRRRAQYLSRPGSGMSRMFPMGVDEADLMIATGTGVLCSRHPLTGDVIRGALTVAR
jgi:hypothetical protein